MTRFLVVPQWQGSPAARAMLLVDGAAAIAQDLPRAATTVLDVPLEAGESLDTGVHRFSALQRVQELTDDAILPETVVVGGDGSVSIAALRALPGGTEDLALVWCGAHPGLHSPGSSPSGAFAGMAVRAALGEGEPQLALSPALGRERVILVGVREIDEEERAPLSGLVTLSVDDLADPDGLRRAVADSGAQRAWVHIDVDVLDPAELSSVSAPAPFGASVSVLTAAIHALRQSVPLAGATIAGFAPRSPEAALDDIGAILRLIGAVA